MIAGDGWGTIAVPVIEAYPATAVIFVGSLLTLVFGVLNLIVAVVVDTFAECRERDVLNLAEEMETDIEMDKRLGSGERGLGRLFEVVEAVFKPLSSGFRMKQVVFDGLRWQRFRFRYPCKNPSLGP